MEAFHSKSEALQYIEDGIERRQYLDCGKLSVIGIPNMRHGLQHHPHCEARSLGITEMGGALGPATYCPSDCRFFIPKLVYAIEQEQLAQKQVRRRKTRAFLKGAGVVLATPFRYFTSLPTLVQALLIIVPIIWLFPQFKETIIDILTALKG